MLPILTSHISVSDFGTLSLIETSVLFLTPFILLNVNSAINVEYFKLEHNKLKSYISNSLLLSMTSFICFLLLFFLLKKELSNLFDFDETIVSLLVLFAGLRVVSSVSLSILQVSGRANHYAYFSIFQAILELGLSYILIVLYKFGYLGRLQGIYIPFFISSILGFYILYHGNYLGKITLGYTKDILRFGLPLIPHVLGGTIMAMSDRYFISYFFNNESVGLYTIAYQMSAVMLLISMSVNQAWTPMLFKLLKIKHFKNAVLFSIGLAIFFVLAGICVYLMKDFLFKLFVDDSYWEAKEYFIFLLLGFVFQSLYFLVTNLLFFERKTVLLATMTVFGAIINILLNYFLIIEFGVIGVAYATSITWFVFFILITMLNIKILKRSIINAEVS